MKRAGEVVAVAVLLALLIWALLPTPPDPAIAGHEAARDRMAVLAAHRLDSSDHLRVALAVAQRRLADAEGDRRHIVLPPAPQVRAIGPDTIVLGGEKYPVPRPVVAAINAMAAHDEALHRALAADSVVIQRQYEVLSVAVEAGRLARAAADGYKGALAQSDSALGLTKDALRAATRRQRATVLGAALVVGAVLFLHR